MLGQVMVTTESPSVLRPLLRTAIQNEAKSLTHGIKRTRERLIAFEKQFGMTSEEFERRYTAAEIDETLASIEWLGEIKMLRVLSEQKLALDGARGQVIDIYFRSILSALRASPVVQSHDMAFDKRGPSAGYVRGVVFCVDESQLHFREFVNTQPKVDRFTYAYHYQAADGSTIFRYDNTPHFPTLSSFPHHKHLSDGTSVIACAAPTLAQVLAEIEAQ